MGVLGSSLLGVGVGVERGIGTEGVFCWVVGGEGGEDEDVDVDVDED
ncbi:predicted protein [Sclerotinia sclerotiorum 1980 UF-70]|uniref:Uncharacterized protein n=1 Tax=Sclerotinia sclerotiorum (strain ATCC 18683 / 1980 / Ss-1) TaxID=665079 RepID=A7EM48_SCLS1|nr:predicted protein [Sclerotinia sclerotiorum 1980 UF-70]EDO03914.1 predicted protein [Sclerotinia sclerotiorum 1980 UF-70]